MHKDYSQNVSTPFQVFNYSKKGNDKLKINDIFISMYDLSEFGNKFVKKSNSIKNTNSSKKKKKKKKRRLLKIR